MYDRSDDQLIRRRDLDASRTAATASNKALTLYLAALPTTTGDIKLTAETSANKFYTTTLTGKTLVAGKAYLFTASPSDDDHENGYAYVDLGLPSGLKWATMNVGAKSVIDYGKYYAWGETKAYGEEDASNGTNYNYNSKNSYVKSFCDSETYKWSYSGAYTLTKYCTSSS